MRLLYSVPAVACSLLACIFHAGTTNSAAVPALIKRAPIGQSIVDLYDAIKDFLANQNAYDPPVPNKCILIFGTLNGASCGMNVQCTVGIEKVGPSLPADEVCYLGGRQYFHVDEIGDFSVTYTKAGGVDGDTSDGLHSPVLQIANVNNWDPIDLDTLINDIQKPSVGKLCDYEP